MDTVDVDGAIAAATYFLTLYPHAFSTGDTAELRELSHPECIFCKSVTDDAEQIHALGQHQQGSQTRVVSASGSEVHPGSWFSVDAHVEQDGYQIVDSAGNIVEQDMTTKAYSMTLVVVYEDRRWLVRAVEYTVE